MANTFKIDTKSSCTTDAHTSATANVVTAGGSATLVLLSILVSNKTGASADVDVFLVTKKTSTSALAPVLLETKILKRTNVAEPPADSTFALVLVCASVTQLDFVSILKVFAILS